MATKSSGTKTRSSSRLAPSAHAEFVPGQLIIKYKQDALQEAADLASVPNARRAMGGAHILPESIRGPVELLRDNFGLISLDPLFGGAAPQRRIAGMRSMASQTMQLGASVNVAKRNELSGFNLATLDDRKINAALIKRLTASASVQFVERVPNRWLSAADPKLNLQWGLSAIKWFNATRPDAKSVHVAVLDTGIDAAHRDLAGAIERYVHTGNGAKDPIGHGTHVAGVIAAAINNGIGIAGIANCRLHCWKVFNDPDRGELPFNDALYFQALHEILDSKIRVVNLSLGGTASSQTEQVLFSELLASKVLIVAAMGNDHERGRDLLFPAGYDDVFAVGATDPAGQRAAFSCVGKHIDIAAPGVGILSTLPMQISPVRREKAYAAWDGTSMATPHVAGVAALLAAKYPGKTAAWIARRLRSRATKLAAMGAKSFTHEYGYGLLNLQKSL